MKNFFNFEGSVVTPHYLREIKSSIYFEDYKQI
jgi:hypothetical protein